MTDKKELLSGYDIMNASHAERTAHAKSIAEGYIRSAATADFGETDGYSYIYAYGLTAGWHHGALISESEMVEYRQRLSAVVADREEKVGFGETDDDSAELEQAWSISARLAAVSIDGAHLLPLAVADLVQEARSIHPTVAHAAALRATNQENVNADKAAFEAHYRKECGMPDQAEFQWGAPYMVAALDGWNAKAAHTATQGAAAVERLTGDLESHKEALKRHADKLASVWSGMAEMMQKTLGHQCGAEPFNDLEVLMLELKSARAALAATT